MITNRLSFLNRKSTKKNDNQTILLRTVTSYSIFLLVILILFLYLYQSTIVSVRSQYNLQERSTLLSNVELFEKDLDIMDVYCRQLLQNDNFRKLMSFDSVNDDFLIMGNALATTLSTDVYPESLLPITEVFCYLPTTGYVLSPNYFVSQERYYDWMKRYDTSAYDRWLKALTSPEHYYQFLSMDEMTPNFSKDYYMYLINMQDLYYLKADAIVCFVLEKEELASVFAADEDESSPDGFLIGASADGIPFLSLGIESFEEDGISITDVLSLSYTKGFSTAYERELSITIGCYQSPETNNIYYYSFPAFNNTARMASHRALYLTIFFAALLLGGILVGYFSRRNVKPIIELGQELHEAVEAQNHLQEVVDSQRPIICNSYVRQLLQGSAASEEEVVYIQEYLELLGDSLVYNGLYIVAYNNANEAFDSPTYEVRTSEEFHQIMMDALENFFGMPLYCFRPQDRTYAILLACDQKDGDELVFRTHEIILQLHNYLLDTYGIWLFAGIGKNTDSLMNVWESYQQAMEAINYTSKNYFFFPYEVIKKDSSAFYYPPELSTKLIHFITTGNTSQVLELFNLIHQENIEERSLPINILKFLLSDIRNTLLKARFALPSSIPEDVTKSLDERFNQHVTFKLCEDIALTLCNLFTGETEDTNLVSTIEKYIENNYMDPSMGLNKISDEFQISESYFSHMFKEKTGVNFSTYLENIRMNEAARLIRETEISLNELYISVGYNNANTFRRAFKKTYGVTPSSMRESRS